MNVLNGREELGLTLKGLFACTVRVFVILAINLWHMCSRLLDSVVSLVSDSAWLYELLGTVLHLKMETSF